MQRKFWKNTGPARGGGTTCGRSRQSRSKSGASTSSVAATPAPRTEMPQEGNGRLIPTCPDISLPWSGDYDHDGWSARMFLHQLCATSIGHWQPSDTEQLLSGWTLLHLRHNAESGISLSDIVTPIGVASQKHFRSANMLRGLIRRALAWRRSVRVLLQTEAGIIPTRITFLSKGEASACLTITSEKPLPDSLKDGLMGYLQPLLPGCAATPSSPE